MKFTKWNCQGREYALSFNGYAMHTLSDMGIDDITAPLAKSGVENFDTVCRIAEVLIQQGELVRRYLGYDPGRVIDAKTLAVMLRPVDDVALRKAIMDATMDGYRSELDEEKEIDLGLVELQKKTGTG